MAEAAARLPKPPRSLGRLAPWLGLGLLAVGLALSSLWLGIWPLLALAGAVVVMVGWQEPRLTLMGLMVAVTFIYGLTTDLRVLPDQAKFIKEAFIALLFARALFTAITQRTFMRTPLDKWLLLFVALGLLSGLVNQTSPLVIAVALRGLFQYALVFYSIVWLRRRFTPRFMAALIGLAVALCLIQLPFGLLEFAYDVRRGIPNLSADEFRGTLGGSGANLVGLFVLPMLFLMMSRIVDSRQWKRSNLIIAFLLAIIPFLSFSRMAWLCAGLGLAILWWRRILLSPRVLAFVGAVGAVTFIALFLAIRVVAQSFENWADLTVSRIVDPAGVVGSFNTPGEGVGLVPWAKVVLDTVSTKAPVPFLGLGPGSAGSSAAVQLRTATYRRYFYDHFGLAAYHLPADLPTQLLQTGAEYGPLGPVLLVIIAFEFYGLARKLRRKERQPLALGLGAALAIAAIVMTVLMIKDGIWEQQMVSMWMWILGGLVVVQLQRSTSNGRPRALATGPRE
jgi:hypothetical protein